MTKNAFLFSTPLNPNSLFSNVTRSSSFVHSTNSKVHKALQTNQPRRESEAKQKQKTAA